MSRAATAALNYQLTQFAVGHMNDLRHTQEVAERLCPTVQVPGANGQFKVFDDINSFQIYATERAMGGDPTRIEFKASDAYYNCRPHALEITVDKEERNQVGMDNALGQQLLDEGKIKALLNVNSLSRAKRVIEFVRDNVTAEVGLGVWSNPDIDPIDQLDQVLDELSTAVGSTEGIKITFSLTSWRTLRNHPKSKARVSKVQVAPLNLQQVNDCLAIPCDIKVSAISYNTAKLGQTQSKARLMATDVYLGYSVPSPTQYDPSGFKAFTVGQNMIAGVRSYMAPNGFYDGHIVDWSEELKKTSSIATRRIAVT